MQSRFYNKCCVSKTIKQLFFIFYLVDCVNSTNVTTTTTPMPATATAELFVNRTNQEEKPLVGKSPDVRSGRDLVYESMKMRSGNWKPRSPDDQV